MENVISTKQLSASAILAITERAVSLPVLAQTLPKILSLNAIITGIVFLILKAWKLCANVRVGILVKTVR